MTIGGRPNKLQLEAKRVADPRYHVECRIDRCGLDLGGM
jgi:hypothetical protein